MEYKLILKSEGETKRFFRYGEYVKQGEEPVIAKIYFLKSVLVTYPTRPEEIEVIIRIPEK